jgi:cytochrome c oxidase assembly protein subunit 15
MKNDVFTTNKPVVVWLFTVSFLILLMVALGGATRLTGSGLSMVDWSLIGSIPPLSDADWMQLFERYKEFPEYKLVNYQMTLEGFKEIFWWEYLHRMLGRLIGMCFALPWFFFMISAQVKFRSKLNAKLAIAFLLGGTQAFIGWYMVKSGLVKVPHVSHLRLTTHLCTAFIIIGYLSWVAMTELWPATQKGFSLTVPKWIRKASLILPFLLLLQIAYGGLNAGLRAGYVFTDFPKMMGHWLPPQAFAGEGFLHSLVFDTTTVHFIHRSFAWLLFFGIILFWWTAKKLLQEVHQKKALNFVVIGIVIQFLLGVGTVMSQTHLHTALAHQVWGCVLFLSSIYLFQQLRR